LGQKRENELSALRGFLVMADGGQCDRLKEESLASNMFIFSVRGKRK